MANESMCDVSVRGLIVPATGLAALTGLFAEIEAGAIHCLAPWITSANPSTQKMVYFVIIVELIKPWDETRLAYSPF